MSTIDLVAPEYREAALSFPTSEYDPTHLKAIRDSVNDGYEKRYGQPATVPKEEVCIPTQDGSPSVRALLYQPRVKDNESLPGILHLHGGGWIAGSADMMAGFCEHLAESLRVVVLSVDYRLAPEAVEPGPMNDCWTAMQWLFEKAVILGVDRSKIAVMGDSAGGGLAAGLALRVRDHSSDRLKAAFLMYPALDHRTGTSEGQPVNPSTGEFVVSRRYARQVWEARVGATQLLPAMRDYFAPSTACEVKGVCPTWIAIGSLDLFLDENIQYALRLSHAAVPLELHVYNGVCHAFDLIPGNITNEFTEDLFQGIQRLLLS